MINVQIQIEQQGERLRYVYSAKADESTTPGELEATDRVIGVIQGYIAEAGDPAPESNADRN